MLVLDTVNITLRPRKSDRSKITCEFTFISVMLPNYINVVDTTSERQGSCYSKV